LDMHCNGGRWCWLELITVPHPCEGVPLGASGTADPAARSVLVGVYRIIFFWWNCLVPVIQVILVQPSLIGGWMESVHAQRCRGGARILKVSFMLFITWCVCWLLKTTWPITYLFSLLKQWYTFFFCNGLINQ
jgi:hypothetical protein